MSSLSPTSPATHRSPDGVVIGAGAIGCALAWRLAQRGLLTWVVDPGPPGGEATGASAGILAPQIESHGAGPLLTLQLASRERYPALIAELTTATGMDVGYRRSGGLLVAGPDEVAGLEQRATWQRALGLHLERLSPADGRVHEPALGEHAAALRFADEAQVEPQRLVRALERAARAAGAEFVHGRALRVLHQAGAVSGVVLGDGSGERIVATPRVVVAAGSWSSLVEGALLPPPAVYPVRGQIVEVETHALHLRHVVFGYGGYLVPRPDGRVLLGSTEERTGYQKEVTVAGVTAVLQTAQRLVPAIAGAAILRTWSGLRPCTGDRLPFLGPTPIAGLHLATGHFRNGILLCPITADALAACALGEPPPVDLTPFSITRLATPHAGGPSAA
jgi:glycine oxidase